MEANGRSSSASECCCIWKMIYPNDRCRTQNCWTAVPQPKTQCTRYAPFHSCRTRTVNNTSTLMATLPFYMNRKAVVLLHFVGWSGWGHTWGPDLKVRKSVLQRSGSLVDICMSHCRHHLCSGCLKRSHEKCMNVIWGSQHLCTEPVRGHSETGASSTRKSLRY